MAASEIIFKAIIFICVAVAVLGTAMDIIRGVMWKTEIDNKSAWQYHKLISNCFMFSSIMLVILWIFTTGNFDKQLNEAFLIVSFVWLLDGIAALTAIIINMIHKKINGPTLMGIPRNAIIWFAVDFLLWWILF